MRTAIRIFVVLVLGTVAVIAGAVAVYQANFPSYTHRYRLTVEMERGSQRSTGSGVIEVTWKAQPQPLPCACTIRGDAVTTNIPGARVIAILTQGLLRYHLALPHVG